MSPETERLIADACRDIFAGTPPFETTAIPQPSPLEVHRALLEAQAAFREPRSIRVHPDTFEHWREVLPDLAPAGQLSYWGMPVYTSELVPEGEAILLTDPPKPPPAWLLDIDVDFPVPEGRWERLGRKLRRMLRRFRVRVGTTPDRSRS